MLTIQLVNPFYSAGMSGYTAIPVPDADEFRLWDDGDMIAEVHRDNDTGRYLAVGDAEQRLYRDWQQALAEASGLSQVEIESADISDLFE